MAEQAGFDLGNFLGIDALPPMFETSLAFNTGQVAAAPNTLETVPSNAIASMSPVTSAQTQSWSGFWQDMLKGVVGYSIAKDAAQTGVVLQNSGQARTYAVSQEAIAAQAAAYQRQQSQASPLVLIVLAGLAVWAIKS